MSKYSNASAGNLELERALFDLSSLANGVKKTITFAGGTSGAIGDKDGALATFPIFTVTGDVMVFVVGICKTTLVGAATLEVGVTDATASILAQIANATSLVENECYADATPTLAEAVSTRYHFIGGGLDIIGTVATADITAGVIDFYCFWKPLSENGSVTAA